ncbi:hypothetical protein EWM64_g1629 [Hericium alpestre]|uniref:chitinase n=1 Tax=Hericium alpestre TaxID=135208 RepID=A0A4Z0A7Z0_9AGAM|nr:hypothetical protein EWM64_g1629 [Hericium alpestre]
MVFLSTIFRSMRLLAFFTVYFGLLSNVLAFDITKNDNLAVYWGQDSAGNQGQLSKYCADDIIDNVILAFLYIFNGTGGEPVIDFANICSSSGNSVFPGTDLANCSFMASQIEACQAKGKIVTLSLGGATGQVGFSSDSAAQSFADKIWNLFLGGSSDTRPFGGAVLDGIDLDIESGSPSHYAAFVKQIRSHASGKSKKYYVTAAPQCPFPDASIGAALNAAPFDAVFVQFYNNFCGLDQPSDYNFDTWDNWSRTKSSNKNIKVYIGAAASSNAADQGYVSASTLENYATSAQDTYKSFGGVMMWDASEAYKNKRYDKAIKNAMTAHAATLEAKKQPEGKAPPKNDNSDDSSDKITPEKKPHVLSRQHGRRSGARGLLEDGEEDAEWSEEDAVVVRKGKDDYARGRKGRRKRGRESLSANKVFGRDELERQTGEIKRDKENLHVRRSLIHSEISEITNKIQALDAIRSKLEDDLLKLQEDELELDDELEMVKERLEVEQVTTRRQGSSQPPHIQSSRRRKGPAFLPSEHDELPHGVAFMTLECGTTPISALDFSEPYGTLVTASQDDSQPRVFDLLSGEEIGRLRGHTGTVKCVQVEDNVCLTGAEDGNIRVWDLRRVDEDDWESDIVHLSDVVEEAEEENADGDIVVRKPNGIRNGVVGVEDEHEQKGACTRVLEGHSKAVTTLYFEDDTLVTGASDKTLRQWDLTTGQCVMTMDILWAISHPSVAVPGGQMPNHLFPGAAAAAGSFAVPTPPYADGSWELYQDFVGAVQFWGYALVSGSGDGAVRMWDMRTGQAHRTLLGHTGPVTSLQFDEIHVVSGSLDKSIRIWDLRTGGIFETIKYDHAITDLQFDSRKVVSAAGENGIKIYNRTSMQHSTLLTNGHTQPVERLRYMDRYLVSGGRDSMVKIWAL